MNYLIGMFQSNFDEFSSFIQNLSPSQIVGLGTLSIILLIFLYSVKRICVAYQKSNETGSKDLDFKVDIHKQKEFNSERRIASKKRAKKLQRERRSKAETEITHKNPPLNNKSKSDLDQNVSTGHDKKTDDHKVEDVSTHYDSANRLRKLVEKRNKESSPVSDSVKKPETKDQILYIGYNPSNKFDQQEDWEYAVVKMPNKESVIRQPVEGKQQVRGYKEKAFQSILESSFSDVFKISGNALISTGNETRPYEPDICISCLSGKRNIFIDVEIDEPYGGITRNATHVKGEDDIRDYYFTDRGWMVIRFAEVQVHKQPQRCAGLIAKVIQEIAPELNLPHDVLNLELPTPVEQWDVLKAQELESENFRESYLNHSFGHQAVLSKEDKAVEMREIDLEVEKEVKPTTYLEEEHEPTNGQINIKHWSERDNRIQFYPEKHVYLIDSVPAKSVTEVVERFFPAFDRLGISRKLSLKRGVSQSEILEKWDRARDQGTHLHVQIENYFNEEEYEEPLEFEYFLNFMRDHSGLNTFRTEWRVFDDKRLMAGTIDYVSKNNDGTFSIYDWKRSKNVVDEWNGGPQTSHPFGTGFGSLSHIDSTGYNKYCLQQGIYKAILERFYGITIRDMNLVVIHPRYSNYHKFEVPGWSEEVNHIMDAI